MKYTIKAKEIYLENEILENASVTVENGKIIEINAKENTGELIDLGNLKLLPGLLDIHVHGGNGYDVMDSTYEAINEISKFKIKEGVTSFCATTVTTSLEATHKAISVINNAMEKGVEGAKIIGPFLEGPYINTKFKGAHPENSIRAIDEKEIMDLIDACKGNVSFAIAPEKDGAIEIIKKLSDKNVTIRLGHTAATYEEAIQAIENGGKIAIHTFNAMTPFTGREPNMVGAVMADDRIYAEIICDNVHVHPVSTKVVMSAKPKNKVILVTDCMRAGGLSDGEYSLGEMNVIVKDSIARTESGSLAGSTLNLAKAVSNVVNTSAQTLLDAVNMASINPARALNIDNTVGSIEKGKSADLIAVDDNMEIAFVMIDGNIKLKS